MSFGVYIRVSSPKGQKTDSQRAELEAWLKRHRHKAVEWFEDRESRTTLQREAFQRLQADIFAMGPDVFRSQLRVSTRTRGASGGGTGAAV